MGTIRFAGVVFQCYSDDHHPRHVHGRYAGVTVVIEIGNGVAKRARRKDAVAPPNAKRSDIRYILKAAALRLRKLNGLWEDMHER